MPARAADDREDRGAQHDKGNDIIDEIIRRQAHILFHGAVELEKGYDAAGKRNAADDDARGDRADGAVVAEVMVELPEADERGARAAHAVEDGHQLGHGGHLDSFRGQPSYQAAKNNRGDDNHYFYGFT